MPQLIRHVAPAAAKVGPARAQRAGHGSEAVPPTSWCRGMGVAGPAAAGIGLAAVIGTGGGTRDEDRWAPPLRPPAPAPAIAPRRHGYGYGASSGSEHEPSSACLAAMVHQFIENENDYDFDGLADCCSDANSSHQSSLSQCLPDHVQSLISPLSELERTLTRHVTKMVDAGSTAFSCHYGNGKGSSSECLQRAVMKQLRSIGYNAAICKSTWGYSGGIPGGDYEYIDVIVPQEGSSGKSDQKRLIVELDFRAQFEIARPSAGFASIVRILPSVFVGDLDKVLRVVDAMSKATKMSLKAEGLHLPPWRRPSYLKAKWLSTYKRTSNDCLQSLSHARLCGPETISECDEVASGIAIQGGHGRKVRDPRELELIFHEGGGMTRDPFNRNKGLYRDRAGGIKGAELTVVVSADWELPDVNPRPSLRPPTVAGLAAVFMHSSTTPSLTKVQ